MAEKATSIRMIPKDDRPRERLLRSGGEALSDGELIAVLLRVGRRGQSAVEMANEILSQNGGLLGLLGLDARGLRRKGLGEAKAATMMAALELARRLAKAELGDRELLDRPAMVADYLSLRYARGEQEVMGALYLDVRHRLIAEADLYRGTLYRAAVEPRAVLKEALLRGAAGFILFHNHPSGDPSPSAEDLKFTRRMAEAGELLGVKLIDHVILGGGGRWVSLKRRGAW